MNDAERDQQIRTLIEEETSRGTDPESHTRPLRIVEHIGGEPRWESDRVAQEGEECWEEAWADGAIAYVEGTAGPPLAHPYPNEWKQGWIHAWCIDAEELQENAE